jgi:hypothetical protein
MDCLPFKKVNGKLINSINNFSLVSKFSGLATSMLMTTRRLILKECKQNNN